MSTNIETGETREGRTMLIATILMSVCLAAAAQLTLKAGMDQVGHRNGVLELMRGAATTPTVWLGLVLFGMSALVWLVALSKASLSFAYPFASLTYAIIVVFDRFVRNESVPGLRWVGVVLIIGGIIAVAQGAHS